MANHFAPTLISPAQKGTARSSSIRFEWKFNHPDPGRTQAQIRLRRFNITDGGVEEWWNGTTWSATPGGVANTSNNVTITTGWTAGKVYRWSIATQDDQGTVSVYADNKVFTAIAAPVVDGIYPSGAIDESRPICTFVYSQTQGVRIEAFRLAVYKATTTPVDPFNPTAAEQNDEIHQSGWISDPDQWAYTLPVDLPNTTNFGWYVQARSQGGLESPVDTTTFNTVLTLPGGPTLVATADTELCAVHLQAGGSFNLLSFDSAVFTSGVGQWIPSIDADLAVGTPTVSYNGTNVLIVSPTGMLYSNVDTNYGTYANWTTAKATHTLSTSERLQAYVEYKTPTGTGGIAVTPTTAYSFIGSFLRNASDSKNIQCFIDWYTAAGAFISTSSGTAQSSGNTTNNTYLNYQVTATSPGTAAFASIRVQYTTADNFDLYMDNALFAATSNPSFSPGGSSSNASFIIERSDDGGDTWKEIAGYTSAAPGMSHESVTVSMDDYDRYVPLAHTEKFIYRAYAVAYNSLGEALYSAPSVAAVSDYLPGSSWWIRDPLDPSRDMQIAQMDYSGSYTIESETFLPVGREKPVVVQTNSPLGMMFFVNAIVQTEAEAEALHLLLQSRRTLVIQSNTAGRVWWVRCTGQVTETQVMAPSQMEHRNWRPVFKINAQVQEVEELIIKYVIDYDNNERTYSEVTQ